IQVINRGPDEAQASLLPTIWFRNTWSWDQAQSRPQLRAEKLAKNAGVIELDHSPYGRRHLLCEGRPELLFTENDTNSERLYGIANASPYVKDGINDYIVHGKKEAVNPDRVGTKAAAHYPLTVGPGDTVTVRLRFTDQTAASGAENLLGKDFDRIFADRRREADEFYAVPRALLDPDFAKDQLVLMLREWYMHPNGQLPAYEWAFGDVNPPVHAWAAWRVYKIEEKRRGKGDRKFLQQVFHKLLLNFTWWVNRKDAEGKNVFQGGFLGLDNIGVFDRSAPLPTGGHIEQSDGA